MLNINWWEEQMYPEVTPSTWRNEFAKGKRRFREKTCEYGRQKQNINIQSKQKVRQTTHRTRCSSRRYGLRMQLETVPRPPTSLLYVGDSVVHVATNCVYSLRGNKKTRKTKTETETDFFEGKRVTKKLNQQYTYRNQK